MYRKVMYLVCFVLLLGLTNTLQAELVGHWTLDDSTGGTVADSSGNGNDGTIVGDPIPIAGVMGGALEFHGPGAAVGGADHIDCGNDTSLDVTSEISIALWIRPDADNPEGGIETAPMSKAMNGLSPSWSYQVRYGWGSPQPYMAFTFNTSPRAWAYVGENLVQGEWVHIAGIHDGAMLTCYLNGVATESTPMGAITSSPTPVLIGSDGWGSDWIGGIDDVRIYNHTLTEDELADVMRGAPAELAKNPSPVVDANDVPLDAILAWEAGEFANTHDVYLGLVWDDVNEATTANPLDVLVSQGQAATTYEPAPALEYGQTYYWRVDEVNEAPDNTVFKGEVWSFAAEPIAFPILSVSATASSSHSAEMGPENTSDESGLDALDQHSTEATDMWLSGMGDATPSIQYEFDKVYKLHELWVWNSNQLVESFLGLGAKDVLVETSTDGNDWTPLEDTTQFAQATAAPDYLHNTTVSLGGVQAKYVRITINAGYGMLPQFGLSEMRFFAIPTFARKPEPADGASTDGADIVLNWRAGREAVSHEVYLGTDAQDLALVGTTSESSFAAGALDYGQTYYWSVTGINEAETPSSYAGDVWSFTLPAYGIVDDFEQYDNKCNRIFFAWEDGLGHNGGEEIEDCDVPASNGNGGGSIVGNDQAPFAEKTIVNTDSKQSMPLNYDNAFGQSETMLTLAGQDWTASAVQTLSLFVYGQPDNSGQLYVKINGTKVVYDGDVIQEQWQEWTIDLTALGGLQNVTTLMIGVDGASAAGMLYIDDIRLNP
jgi:hypothetical protein